MGGGASAEGIRMQASTSTTYPVFLRSVNPSGGGETSAWLFKEDSTPWGIWHNNPINALDITRASTTGIENNVGGGTNTVMIRLSHSDGSGQFTGNILNRTGTAILDQSGNTTGNAATSTTFSTGRTNYKGVTDGAVAGQLMWKNYGNLHTLFDASAATSPSGGAVSRHTPDYPVSVADGGNSWGVNINLMGWNGSNTYGVKVDWSRYSESAGLATQVVTIQDAAPSGSNGQLWWESDTGRLKVYYSSASAWVDATSVPDMSLYYPKAGGVINGDVSVQLTLTVSGNTLVEGTIRSYSDIIAYSSSDVRLKDNIRVIESPIEKISKISGVSFNWNNKQSVHEVGTKDYGVIAQEIEEVLPELVTTRDDGYKAVRYEKVVPLLIESIKEQQSKINELENIIIQLTQKINSL